MSRRTEQISATLHRAIQTVINRGFADPRIEGIVTVMRVDVSSDLRNATVFVSISPAEKAELTMHGLRSATRHIRHEVGEIVALRRAPTLHLKMDSSLKEQAAVLQAIHEATKDSRATEADDSDVARFDSEAEK